MRKQTKVVAVASAAALLAIGASMTSFAATGWVEEDGVWYFYDRDGNRVEDEWKKSGDNWYWLDSEESGAMAMDKLVEDDEDTYYVDANGVMVRNTWVKVVNEDQDDDDEAEYDYYYMQSNGKAYKQKGDNLTKKVIDGKKYAFNQDGKMLYGWVDEEGEMQNDDSSWEDALYYFGEWNDGAMKTGWQKITVYDEKDDKDDDYDYWFNFKSNGQKRVNANKKKLNNKYYNFDDRGVMVYEWYQTASTSVATASNTINWNYFSSPEDGARVYKGWFKVAPPTEDNTFLEEDATFASEDSKDESERWYYSDEDGLVEGKIKKIKGKYYGFWPADDGANKGGRMLVGLCALEMEGDQIIKVWGDDMDSDKLDDFMNGDGDFKGISNDSQENTNVYLYYFGDAGSQDSDGAMKTGNVSLNLDGDSYQFLFKKSGGPESRGRGVNGIDDGDYIYRYGQKLKADSDDKYILVYATGSTGDSDAVVIDYNGSDVRAAAKYPDRAPIGLNGLNYNDSRHNSDNNAVHVVSGFSSNLYLLNTSGKIQSAVTAKKDGDDWYWYSTKNGVTMYTSEKDFKGIDDMAGSNWKDTFGKKEN